MSTGASALPATGELSRLAILGLLAGGPNHGYGLRSVMEDWQMHRWADIKFGSIYAALARLERDGFVVAVDTVSDGGPPRTRYQLTAAGGEELRRLLVAAWRQPTQHVLSTNVALAFLPLSWLGSEGVSPEEVDALLVERVVLLEQGIAGLAAERDAAVEQASLPALANLVRDHFDHGIALATADLEWSRSTLEALRRGDYAP